MSYVTRCWLISFSVAVAALVTSLHIIMGKLLFTGDEVRYAYAGVAALLGNDLSIDRNTWASWLVSNGLSPSIEAGRGTHSIIHVLLLSPFITILGLEAGRWLQLLIVLGIATPYLIATDKKRGVQFACWTTIYLVSVPVLPYLRLIYSEAWLFLILSILLFYSSRDNFSTTERAFALACVILLPFMHIRMALVAAIFGVYVFCRAWQQDREFTRSIGCMIAVTLIAMLVFACYQVAIGGRVFGTASVATMPAIEKIIYLFAAQTSGYRHGMFLYNPLALIGVAGLLLGLLKRNIFRTCCALAFFAYLGPVIWATASESYAGRFWVPIVPFLIYGSVYWFSHSHLLLRWFCLIPLGFIALCNALLLIFDSKYYIENRFGAAPYDFFQQHVIGALNPGFLAAIDPLEGGNIVIHQSDIPLIFLVSCALIICLVGIGSTNVKRVKLSLAVAAALFVFLAYNSIVKFVPTDMYAMDCAQTPDGTSQITFTMQDREMLQGFKIGGMIELQTWGIDPDKPKEFLITGYDPDGHPYPTEVIAGYPLGKFSERKRYSKLTIVSPQAASSLAWCQLPIRLIH